MARRRLTADEVATSARLAGVPPALALAIWEQESGGGANVATSGKGAVGDFQVKPSTFKQYHPTGNINDPVDNMQAALSYMAALLKRYGGDWEKVGQAYYHGSALPAGVRGPTSGPGTPDTRAYGEQVVARAKRKQSEQPSLETLVSAPAGATSTARNDLFNSPMSSYSTPTPTSTPTAARPRAARTSQVINPELMQWHALTAQAPQQQELGDFGPPEPMSGYGEPDQVAMQQGGEAFDLDQYIRGMVDDIV